MNSKKISVLIVDDSMMFRMAISKGLGAYADINVVGTADGPYDARDKILQLKPDVLTLDVNMPRMNGLEFLRILMPQYPMPVIVVSGADGIVFEAMRAGAVDFVAKPEGGPTAMGDFVADLAGKIRIASRAVIGNAKRYAQSSQSPAGRTGEALSGLNSVGLIAIGASTGGTEATSALLRQLPNNVPGIVITQHMPPVFTRMYADRLYRESALVVKEAQTGDIIKPGRAFVAPGDKHMTVLRSNNEYMIKCMPGEKVNGHCPSVDVLFDSVAKCAGRNAVGVLLTGMGADGARGLLNMRNCGAYTIGQDKDSCVVYGMPMEAYKMGAVCKQASLNAIPSVLLSYIKTKRIG